VVINNSVKWRRFIVPKKKLNKFINKFKLNSKSNKLKIGMNEMRVNERETSMKCKTQTNAITRIVEFLLRFDII